MLKFILYLARKTPVFWIFVWDVSYFFQGQLKMLNNNTLLRREWHLEEHHSIPHGRLCIYGNTLFCYYSGWKELTFAILKDESEATNAVSKSAIFFLSSSIFCKGKSQNATCNHRQGNSKLSTPTSQCHRISPSHLLFEIKIDMLASSCIDPPPCERSLIG